MLLGEIILISLEAYFEFLIGGYINYLFYLDDQSGEYIGKYTAYYSLVISMVVLPAFMIFVMTQSIETLRDPSFEAVWGSLYEGISLKNKWQLASNLVFMIRRAFFVFLCFNLDRFSGMQILMVKLLNLATLIYYGNIQPFQTRFMTRINLFNEFCISLVTWHLMLFSDFVPGQETQYQIGWSMIFTIVLNAIINLIVVLGIVGK